MVLYNVFPSDLDTHPIEQFEAEVEAEFGFGAHDPIATLQNEFNHELILPDPFDFDASTSNLSSYNEILFDDWFGDNLIDGVSNEETKQQSPRSPNAYQYEFGNVFKANWYIKFLHPNVRDRTYHLSTRDRYGSFCGLFRVPLYKVDELVQLFLNKGWIHKTQHCRDDVQLNVKAQLLILATLNILGHHTPIRTLSTNTEISTSEHRSFLHLFLDADVQHQRTVHQVP